MLEIWFPVRLKNIRLMQLCLQVEVTEMLSIFQLMLLDQMFRQLLLRTRKALFLRIQFGALMVTDAIARKESCGCHFNEAYQTEEHEALRDDEQFRHVAAWEYKGEGHRPVFHKESLGFENVALTQRSYK